MLRWFRAFLPKEERFFDLFARHSQTVVQGALALQGMLRGGEETPVFCQRVNQFENDADNITREVLTAVRRTFITPFDRGDIKNLITVDGRRHRPDAADRQGGDAVRGPHLRAADARDGRRCWSNAPIWSAARCR